jgi:PAS domain S-box-containing protein
MGKKIKIPGQSADILIVEDSPTQAAQIKYLLENHQYKVEACPNGQQAFSWLSDNKPLLVISDIVMPQMNGFELCEKIKSDKSTENIPVILLTSLSDPEEILTGLSSGADSFITKPYDKGYLLSQVNKLLSGHDIKNGDKVPFDITIMFKGKKRSIQTEQHKVVNLLLNIYEGAVQQNEKLINTQEELRLLNEKLELIIEDRTSDLKEEIRLSNEISERLRESEQKYRCIFESVTDLYYETSVDGTIIDVSPSISILSKGQYSRDDLIGKSIYDHYSDPDKRRILVSEIIEHGTVNDFEILLKNRDGTIIPCSVSAKIILGSDGKPEKIIGSMRDISERKHAEDELKRSQTQLLNAHRIAHLGSWEYDVENDMFIFNDPFYEIFRTTAEKAGGYTMRSGEYTKRFVHPEDRQMIGKEVSEAIETNDPDFNRHLEHRFFYTDGKIGYLNVLFFIIKDDTGKTVRTYGVIQDITERKKTEFELIKAKEKAEESDRLKTAFLHNISHEIRTPMNAIVGFASLLGEPGLDPQKQQSYVEMIIRSSNHLLEIISDIVDISNIEANLTTIHKTETDINFLINDLCNQFILKAEEKRINLLFESGLAATDSKVITDSTKLKQIISNLLNNALKFTISGSVKISCRETGRFLEFSVSDTGIGIPKEYHERIFYRFFQVQHSESRLYGGTGLGLAISKAYVELMGGRIWVSSEQGNGATFFFTIPFEKPVEKSVPVTVESIKPDYVFPGTKNILVAEDIDSNFMLIDYFLSFANIKVLKASNGKEALDIAISKKDIDLILMDIKMPEMDGYMATRLIREAGIKVPIIAQTAYVNEREKAIESGCSGFISKPFDRKKLISVIAEYLQ